ncbi:response regulator [Candidatus Parabeggiatoa sp. HSG14]|uniref:response regulator n=1 Tax=Candidatus Parabeggiatoa sp. HSG14 TaxID=3055593 RepID=UPI0025A7F7C5|nr:response regulator [Thiotrichales bacterium HSG14]
MLKSIQKLQVDLQKAQILLVEDDKINQMVVQMMLESLGCQIEFATNGQESLEMMTNKRYDLVLMDVHMPVLDGYKATKQIRQHEKNTHLPIIAMTADIVAGDFEACLESGMNDVIAKPITKDSLELMLKKWLIKKSKPTSPVKTIAHNILLAEDNKINQIVEKIMLEQMGYHVKIANDGQEAIEMSANEHYDLVLMDIHLPILDGCVATEQIRQREQNTTTHLPIIAVTASATAEDIQKCTQAGMDDFLEKPISRSSLAQILNKWLDASENL